MTTTGTRRMLAVFALVGVALTVVITAPVLLSSQDLYRWATDPHGLGLPGEWAWLVPVALDCAATAMIGMTIVCAWRRERPGLFEVLVWVFAGVSAYAQYLHGVDSRDAGGAQDAWWAFPAFAILGPVLLHVTLARLRRWARQDAGEQARGAAGFGSMWIPGVAFRQTVRAWAASRREQIATVDAAVAYVREVAGLKGLSSADALRYAFGALGTADTHAARVWLQARGVAVSQAAIDAVTVAATGTANDAASDRHSDRQNGASVTVRTSATVTDSEALKAQVDGAGGPPSDRHDEAANRTSLGASFPAANDRQPDRQEPATLTASLTATSPPKRRRSDRHPDRQSDRQMNARKTATTAAKVARAASRKPDASTAELARLAGVSESTVRRHLPAARGTDGGALVPFVAPALVPARVNGKVPELTT